MKDLSGLLKQAQAMQSKMAEVQAELERLEIEGTSGAGLVRVLLSGKGELKRLNLDPTLLKPEEREILEDLIIAAHGDARKRLDERLGAEMAKLTGGLGLPPGLKLPF